MERKTYRWCVVPECRNTSISTPNKLFIDVPRKADVRKKWLKLARRQNDLMSSNSPVYFCEDHFDLPNDMENYMRYRVMGYVKKIVMKPGCVPSKFSCQADRKGSIPSTSKPRPAVVKRKRLALIQEALEDNKLESTKEITTLSHDIQTDFVRVEPVPKTQDKVMVISTYNMDQMYLREDRQRRRRRTDQPDQPDQQTDAIESDTATKDKDDDKQVEGDKNKEKPSGEEKTESEEKKKQDTGIDSEVTILDNNEDDDLSHLTPEMFPAYSTERGVDASFLGEFRFIECKLCRKLLDTGETVQLHLKTWRHQQLFMKLLLQDHYERIKREQEKQESSKRPAEMDDDNDSGNWKRFKITVVKDEDGQEHSDEPNGVFDEDVTMKEEVMEDDLEDWEQTVDEILEDENIKREEPEEEEPVVESPKKEVAEKPPVLEEVVEKDPEKEKSPPQVPAPSTATPGLDEKPRGSPRGRGRGRARGRGRGRARGRGRY